MLEPGYQPAEQDAARCVCRDARSTPALALSRLLFAGLDFRHLQALTSVTVLPDVSCLF